MIQITSHALHVQLLSSEGEGKIVP